MHTSSHSAIVLPTPPPIADSMSHVAAPPRVVAPPLVIGSQGTRQRWKSEGTRIERAENRLQAGFPLVQKTLNDKRSQNALVNLAGRFNYKTIKQKVEDAPSWLVSVIAHLLLLLILALISTSSGRIGRIVLTLDPSADQSMTELVEISIDPIELDDVLREEDAESKLEIDPLEFEVKVQLASLAAKSESVEVPVPTEIKLLPKPLPSTPKSMFGGRTGALKQELLKQSGGTQATEDAVAMGLEWLKRQQLGDGSWSLCGPYDDGARSENKVGATAMAMLAFMGAGSTHRGGEYQKELWRAVKWLVDQQDRKGFMAGQAAEHEKMYAQAQAMIALCELYAMTGDSWIRPYAQRSCDFAAAAQAPQGGWRYQPRFDSDTSVTGWFVMGLKSGEAAGLEVSEYIWPKVEKYLDSVSAGGKHEYHKVGYSYMVGDAPSPSMTAEGLLCRQYMGWHRNEPGMVNGLGALAQNHPIDFREPDVYYWYYATQALHHFGGPVWTQWNDKLKVELPAQQVIRGRERGSWAPMNDAWGRHAGRLYTTCLSLYCLEVYYRHMPLYDPDDKQ
ncbi:MAG: terpene cyclase/mutase family protein [Planctomycetales bacterium]|nr:terpene cyclase/mutase family protein [Planctomycetales bacterium]